MAKTVSMSVGEFMQGKEPKPFPKMYKFVTYPLATMVFYPMNASAATNNLMDGCTKETAGMTQLVGDSFSPIFELLRAAGLPVAGVVLFWAAYNFICAKFTRGWTLVKGAGIGYIALNLIPLGLQILTSIGDHISCQ